MVSKRFELSPKPKARAVQKANTLTSWSYFKKINRYLFRFDGTYNLDLKKNTCDCKYYLKYAYCSHQLALNKLMEADEFVNKPKKGRPKLNDKWFSKK